MPNLSNIVYEFAVWLEENAASDAAVKDAIIHADTYEEMNEAGGTKFIRVDDLIGSKPVIIGGGALQEADAILDVQFLKIPVDQTLTKRLEARSESDAMAAEFITSVYTENRTFRVSCEIIRTVTMQKMNGWRKVGNVKTPVSIVRLRMNENL